MNATTNTNPTAPTPEMLEDLRVSGEINRIRREAGNTGSKCPLCGGQAHAPYRSFHADGTVRAGCVDSFHTLALECDRRTDYPSTRESVAWHFRPMAVELRKSMLHFLNERNACQARGWKAPEGVRP